MRLASYLQNNSLIQEFADWFKEETGRDDFFLGTYTNGEVGNTFTRNRRILRSYRVYK